MEKTEEGAIVQSPTSVPGQQSKSEAPKDSTQEEGITPAQTRPILRDFKIASKMSTHAAGTSGNADASTLTTQESNQTGKTTSAAGDNTNDNVPSSGMTSQEQTQTTTSTSGAIADSDTKNNIKRNTDGNPSQEPNLTGKTTSASGDNTNDNVLSSGTTSQEQTQTTTSTSGAIANTDIKNDINANNSAVNSSTSGGSADGDSGSNISDDPELRSFTLLDDILQENEVIQSMAVISGTDTLLTGSDNQTVQEWHKGKQFAQFDPARLPRGPVYAIDLQYIHRPDSGSNDVSIFLAHNRGEIGVWVISDVDYVLRPAWTLKRFSDQLKNSVWRPWRDPLANRITCLCVSEECDIIYTGSADCTLNMWQSREYHFNPVETIRAHKAEITALTVGRSMFFSGSADGEIKMWKREVNGSPGEKVRHYFVGMVSVQDQDTMIPAAVNALAFQKVGHAQSGYLYAGSSDGKVRCWMNLSVGEPEVMSFHEGEVTCLALCSGPLVFSGSADNTICVWRRENEAVNQIAMVNHTIATVLRGHSQRVTCIKAHDDWESANAAPGNRKWILFSGSHDQTLKIWRVFEQPQMITGEGQNA